MLYVWQTPEDYPTSHIGEYQDRTSPDRFLFMRAERYAGEEVPRFRFDAPASVLERYQILPNNLLMPLVSNEVADWMMQISSHDIQLIPAEVRTQDGVRVDGFALANVLTAFECLDLRASKLEYIPGTSAIMRIHRMRLMTTSLSGHLFVREKNYMSIIIVSEVVKREFEKRAWQAYMLSDPERTVV